MTRRLRRRFAWIGLLALLFQQSALAGHLCAQTMSIATNQLTASAHQHGCHDSRPAPVDDASGACRQHCDAKQTRVDPPTSLSVPLLAMGPSPWPAAIIAPIAQQPALFSCHRARGDPPPLRLFCSLLI